MKQKLSLFLAALMLLSSLTACGEAQPEEKSASAAADTQDPSAAEEAVEAPEEIPYENTLKEADFGGRTFTLGVPQAYNMNPEELTGETINDAVYYQMLNTEDKYNVDVMTADPGSVTNSIVAGDNAYQIFSCGTSGGASSYVLTGYVQNLFKFEDMDFSKPWWNQNTVSELTLNNKLYMAFGDLCAERGITYTHSFYFNKKLADDFGINQILEENYQEHNMYDMVRTGKWTIDALELLISGVSVDVNGDGQMNFDDMYGLGQSIPVSGVYRTAFDHTIMSRDADGVPVLNINTDKFNAILPRIYALCFENPCVLEGQHAEEGLLGDTFVDGRLLLYSGFLCDVAKLRTMEDEFGVLPFPKYDEAQENYFTTVRGDNYFLCIPVSVPEEDYEFVGLVSELLAYYGYTLGRPAVYDDTLKGKMARDEDSIEMLDVLVNGIIVEYAFAHANDKSFSYVLWNLLNAKQSSFATYYKAKEKMALKYYDDLLEIYNGLED